MDLIETTLALEKVLANKKTLPTTEETGSHYSHETLVNTIDDTNVIQSRRRLKKSKSKGKQAKSYKARDSKNKMTKAAKSEKSAKAKHSKSGSSYKSKGKGNSKDPIREYSYCPDLDSKTVPCAHPELPKMCDKYNGGDFKSCYEHCKPSFCCIHDSESEKYSPSCSRSANCVQYSACYIVWWKLHDTVGPANYIHTKQDDDFYNMKFSEFQEDLAEDKEFLAQLFGHHFDSEDAPTDDKFVDTKNW